LTPTPDTAEDSKPTAELPLLLRPVAALQPRISAAERSRSLYFRCKKQRKQLMHRSPQLMQLGPQGAGPLVKGNCVAAMRGGEEAAGANGEPTNIAVPLVP
jgi:hypothetical protein